MAAALGAEELESEARERTGLADFGDPIYREGLDVLLGDLARAELSDLGRAGLPGEIGCVIAFLASRRNSYMTGANINVDGGSDFA